MWINKFFRSKEVTSVEILDAWEVRYISISFPYSIESGLVISKPMVKVFKDEDSAIEFKSALEDAYKLTGVELSSSISIKKCEV